LRIEGGWQLISSTLWLVARDVSAGTEQQPFLASSTLGNACHYGEALINFFIKLCALG